MNNLFTNKNINNRNKNKKIRVYTIVDFPLEGETTGNYKGKTPKAAAAKAFNRLCKEYNYTNSMGPFNYIEFHIKEVGDPENKTYRFYGTRSKLYKPISVNYEGKIIKHHYKNIITKCRDEQK